MKKTETIRPAGTGNTVYSDFTREVVAAGLAAGGYDPDRIFITRRESSPSNTGKEITGIRFVGRRGKKPDVFISTNRPGIYDWLPEGLFHASVTRGSRSKESILQEIRVHREEEFYIRRFFSLYETEVERMRVDIQSLELAYDKPYRDKAFISTLKPFWPVIGQMDPAQANVFVRLIPYLHQIRNSLQQAAQAMSMILTDPTEIDLTNEAVRPAVELPRLGEAKLGADLILDGLYRGSEPTARIKITPRPGRETRYVEGGELYGIARSLARIVLPARFGFRIEVSREERGRHFTLGDKCRPCVLGMNSSLKGKRYESQEQ